MWGTKTRDAVVSLDLLEGVLENLDVLEVGVAGGKAMTECEWGRWWRIESGEVGGRAELVFDSSGVC